MHRTCDNIGEPFIGRDWLIVAINDWLLSTSQYLFVTGPPGTGKSAVVDHLWGQGLRTTNSCIAVHRCSASDRRSCDPVRFSESLAQQFGDSLPGFTDALLNVTTELAGRRGEIYIEGSVSAETVHPSASVTGVRVSISNVSAQEAFDRLIVRPLERLGSEAMPIVVIDGLDEALTYRANDTIAQLVLDGTAGLPLRFVIATRNDTRVLAAIEYVRNGIALDLVDDAPEGDSDLFDYALHRLENIVTNVTERADLARRLARKGAGNYLFVYHLTKELGSGARTVTELDSGTLPSGLEDLYLQFIRREIRPIGNAYAEERWRAKIRPVLSLLVSSLDDGFSAAQVAEILDSSEPAILDIVNVLEQFLLGEARGPWRVYHRSFAEFLLRGPDPHLDAAEGHLRIIDHAFKVWSDGWSECGDPYYFRHLADHLMTALECPTITRQQAGLVRDRLCHLADSEAFLSGQQAILPGRDPHLATIMMALDVSLRDKQYGRAARLGLAQVKGQLASDSVSPVEAALAWGIDAGLAKARAYPPVTSLIWHQLIMIAFIREGRAEYQAAADALRRFNFAVSGGSLVAVAAMAVPIFSQMDSDSRDALLKSLGDEPLSHLSLFLLEKNAPALSVIPALRIQEDLARARAITEIVLHAVFQDEDVDDLAKLGDALVKGFRRADDDKDDVLGRSSEDDSEYDLYIPEVPDAVLVAEATRGEFDRVRKKVAGKADEYAVFLGLVVDAILHGGASVEEVHSIGTSELELEPGNTWIMLQYSNYLHVMGDPRVPKILDRIVKLCHKGADEYDSRAYTGHVDSFHGRCDVGRWHQVIRALCNARRTSTARRLVTLVPGIHPFERLRMLACVHKSEANPDIQEEDRETARQIAADAPADGYTIHTQAMLTFVTGQYDPLLKGVSETLASSRGSALVLSCTAMATLAWAAHLRRDDTRARRLAKLAFNQLTAMPEDKRSTSTTSRVARALLRAQVPKYAKKALSVTTGQTGEWLHDRIDYRLIMGGELESIAALREIQGLKLQMLNDDWVSLMLRIRWFELDGDFDARGKALEAANQRLDDALRKMRETSAKESDWGSRSSLGFEYSTVEIALLAASLNRPKDATYIVERNGWMTSLEGKSWGWDMFRGYIPRQGEQSQQSDKEEMRRSRCYAHLAEAFHVAGNSEQAAAWLTKARERGDSVAAFNDRAQVLVNVAEVAARSGWFHLLPGILPELAGRVNIGSVAEILTVTILRGGPKSVEARDALHTFFLSGTLANFDYFDLLSQLALLDCGETIEALLVGASAEIEAQG